VDAVGRFLRRNPDSPVVRDVLGTVDERAIRQRARELDPEAEEIFFFTASVGALFGIRRRDGSRVAVKVHGATQDELYLDEVQRAQLALAEDGFPAPRPLGRRGLATFEEWLDGGSFRDAHEPAVRTAMATALATFHSLATASGGRPHRRFFPLDSEALWPAPHNALFDFTATADGAEWIDEIARLAKPVRDAGLGREVVGHADWSVKHLRFDELLRPTVLYDWDSVTVDREPALVGTAAGSFTYTEELPEPVFLWPSAAETRAFIDEYEAARGAPFPEPERRAAGAAAVYLRAYAARCTHALDRDAHWTGLAEYAEELL
jgi:hypothetical protein